MSLPNYRKLRGSTPPSHKTTNNNVFLLFVFLFFLKIRCMCCQVKAYLLSQAREGYKASDLVRQGVVWQGCPHQMVS